MVNWRNGARVGYNAGHSAKKIHRVMSTLMLTTPSHCTFTLYIHIFFMIVLIATTDFVAHRNAAGHHANHLHKNQPTTGTSDVHIRYQTI